MKRFLFPVLSMSLVVAACGGGHANEGADRVESNCGPGSYEVGPQQDAKRVLYAHVATEAEGKIALSAEVHALQGDAFWRVQSNGAPPVTGRLMPAGDVALANEEVGIPAGSTDIEVFVVGTRHGRGSWNAAKLVVITASAL